MLRSWPVRFCFSLCALFTLAVAHAAVPERILQVIDSSTVTPLPGNVPVLALRGADTGALAAERKLTELSLRFNILPAQQAALDQFLLDQQDPSSPRYHQWLTPEEFAARFGLAKADLAKASAWLQSQGFTVTEVSRGGTFIRFSGTVAQVQTAFHTQLRQVSLEGEQHFANLTAPSLPKSLAAVTAAITGLHDFHPKPYHRLSSARAPGTMSADGTRPAYTSSSSGSHYIAPGDFYTIYDVNALFASGINGAGVTIGVMGQTDVYYSDLAAFRSVSGLAANAISIRTYGADPGFPSSADLAEAELDLEWAGAAAPGANILYVNATDIIDGSLTAAIDNNLAPILTVSYGACEAFLSSSQLDYYNSLIKMANAQGQAVMAAAGDSGATDCDTGARATQGLTVDFPASLPGVVAVGGTMFNEGTGTYFSQTNGANSGSALSYIPERVWNESDSYGLAAGGGGVSAFFTKPSWQVGPGVPADASRDVPDISLNAASGHDGYLICLQGYCSNGYRSAAGYLAVVGGTSVGAPSFAGLLALVEQQTGGRLGNPNPKIYALANSVYAANVFHDITSGNNASPCLSGSMNCPSGGTIGYNAGPGYDLATGWGSIDAYNLVTKWALVTAIGTTGGAGASSTSLGLSATSATAGTPVTVTATVAPATGAATATPTGTVQFLVDNVAVGTAVTIAGGVATYSLPTTSLSAGTHTVTAAYSGDAIYAGSKSSGRTLAIAAAASSLFTISPATLSVTVPGGSSLNIPLTITPVSGFTGPVQLSATSTSWALHYSFSANPVTITSGAAVGTTLFVDAFTYRAKSGGTQSSVKRGTTAGIALAGLLVVLVPKRRRRMAGLLAGVLSFGLVALSGCGLGGNTSINGGANTPSGTYTINVTASATSGGNTVTHSSVITVTVR